MRRVSGSTIALAKQLYRVTAERGPHAGAVATLLQQIEDAREPLVIPWLVSWTLDDRSELAEHVGEVIQRLRRLVAVRDLGVFDRAFRTQGDLERWRAMVPADLRIVAARRAGPTLLQLATCHASGYIREEAVRRLATGADGTELGFLLLRSNDWVEPVRARACAALRARLTVEHVPELLVALPIVDQMSGWVRREAREIAEVIEALLRDPRAFGHLRSALSSRDPMVRRAVYRRLFESARGDSAASAEVFTAALRDVDPAVRTWAGGWLASASEARFLAFAPQLIRSRSGAVRFAAVQRLPAPPWAELLLDGHGGVRAVAQGAALDAGALPDEQYRAHVRSATGRLLGIALIGLGETGGLGDQEVVRRHLQSELPVVRASALHALAQLGADDLIALATAALVDDSPRVTRMARGLLVARVDAVNAAELWATLATANHLAGKHAVLAVLARLGFWSSLPHLLRALSDDDLHAPATRYLERWLSRQHRVHSAPPAALVRELRRALGESPLQGGMRSALSAVLDARVAR